MPMNEISTIEDLVDALGGDTAVARWLNISQPAVANWKTRQDIPPGWHLRIFARLRSEHRHVDPALFGMTREEARSLCGPPRPLARRRRVEERAA